MTPLNECNRRNKKECPWPARNGATPGGRLVGLAVVTTDNFPCRFKSEWRTFYYVGARQVKSRQPAWNRENQKQMNHQGHEVTQRKSFEGFPSWDLATLVVNAFLSTIPKIS
jgi:hypothetical protein